MIPDGIHAPQQVVQAEGHPRERNVVAPVRRPHPAEVAPGEPPIVRFAEKILVIVPVDDLVLEGRQERGEGDESNERGDKPVDPPPGQCLGHRFMELRLGYTFSPAGLLAAHGSWQARRSLRRGTSDGPLLSSLYDLPRGSGILSVDAMNRRAWLGGGRRGPARRASARRRRRAGPARGAGMRAPRTPTSAAQPASGTASPGAPASRRGPRPGSSPSPAWAGARGRRSRGGPRSSGGPSRRSP